MRMRINIKPLSVNQCWQGRRFKTRLYKDYEQEVLYSLSKGKITQGGLVLRFTVGLSSRNADLDNLIKPFLDILQKKYQFNDKMIYKIIAEKEIVKKGKEYIDWELTPIL